MSDGESEAHREARTGGYYSCGCYWSSEAGETKRRRHFCTEHKGNRVLGPTLADDPHTEDGED